MASLLAQESSPEAEKMLKTLKKYENKFKKYEQRIEELEAEVGDLRDRFDEVESDERVEELRGEVEELIDETQGEVIEERTISLLNRYFGNSYMSLGGYFNVEYLNDDKSDSTGRFRLHRVSLFFQKRVGQFNFFTEVEFEDAPKFEGEGGDEIEEARGEIIVEQAWAEYLYHPLLNFRAGLILLPEYYNLNHYPTTTFATNDPLHSGNILPEEILGVAIYGDTYGELHPDFGIGYQLYVSNGENPNIGKEDVNENKAVGGKLTFHMPLFGLLDIFDLGVNVYVGEDDEDNRDFIWNFEAIIETERIFFHFEYAEGRKDFDVSANGLEESYGYYAFLGYQLTPQHVVFTRYEFFDEDRSDEERITRLLFGVRYRPLPEISIKGEIFREWHEDSDEEDFNGIALSFTMLL